MRAAAGLLLLLSLCRLASAAPADRASLAERCPASEALVTPPRPLGHFAAALRAGGPVRVLAIGSGTTSGQDQSGAAAYPRRLEAALRQDLPKADIVLTVRGGLGMTAAEMLPIIEAELAEHRFALVIWQTGTVEAVHAVPAAAFAATVGQGAAMVGAAGADLVLVGPQFSRLLLERAHVGPFTAALEAAGAAPGRGFFDRLALTRAWVETGRIDLERVPNRNERQAVLELLHACVGDALARFLVNGAMRQ